MFTPETNINSIVLVGTVSSAPTPDHMAADMQMYQFGLTVKRKSGADDVLNIICSQDVLDQAGEIKVGDRIRVNGRMHTKNILGEKGPGKFRLRIVVLAKSIEASVNGEDINDMFLRGTICKKLPMRDTPLGRTIQEFTIAINGPHDKSVYLPVLTWGNTAHLASTMKKGDIVDLRGRFQSRTYNKVLPDGTNEERVAYECSIGFLAPYRKNLDKAVC